MKYDIPQIGMTRQILNSNNVFNINEIANEYYRQQQLQTDVGEWSYDRYQHDGSSGNSVVCSPGSSDSKHCSIWSVNHYLGLNRHPYVINKVVETVKKYGTGSGTSAMSGGHSHLHKDLQIRLADFLDKEEVLLFPTGFTANIGALSAICHGRETLILLDKDCHASIIDGCKASGAKYLPFKHNSINDLEKKLDTYKSRYINIVVIIEGVYSMAGDVSPIERIVKLKEKFEFLLYVDEAHSFGFYGKNGGGLCNKFGVTKNVDFIMTTLSKSTASIGGLIATSKAFCSLLRWSTAYMFQASIPPADVAAINACLDLFEKDSTLVDQLWDKVRYFRKELEKLGFDTGSGESPIVPAYIRHYPTLKKMEYELFERNIFTLAIPYPAVKATEVRFRFIVNNSHSFGDINYVVTVLRELGIKHGLINKDESIQN